MQNRRSPIPPIEEQLKGTMFEKVEPRARRSDPETSHAAADSMRDVARVQRAEVLKCLRLIGPLTCDEIDKIMHWRPTTAGRRMRELERHKPDALVEETTERRKTRSKRNAIVWKAVHTLTREP